MPANSSHRRVLIVAACLLGAMVLPLARAAEGSPGTGAASQPLDFSGGSLGERLLPDRGASPAERGRLEFLNSRSSMGGVLQGSGEFTAPLARPQGIDGRNADRSRGRINFEEVWFQGGRTAGGGLSTEDFERAAGLRSPGANTAGNDSGNSLSGTPSTTPLRGLGSGERGASDLPGGRLDSSPQYDLRRSLDPVLDMGVEDLGRGRSGVPSGVGLLDGSAESQLRTGVRSEPLAPLRGNTLVDLNTAPRSLRDYIDNAQANPQALGSPGTAGLGLERDTTRDELYPYVPRSREDFQASTGDSRLGVGVNRSNPLGQGRTALGSQGSRIGSSSLSPALVLPAPESVVVPPRRTTEAQFPSRRF